MSLIHNALVSALSWSEFSSWPVKVYEVTGAHASMLTKPNVQTLADILRRSLEEKTIAASKIEM
jgi:thioesterase domain-containing protein